MQLGMAKVGLHNRHLPTTPNGTRCSSRRTTIIRSVAEVLEQAAPTAKDVPAGLNKYSSRITQPKSQGASQAMLYGTGMTPDDMNKPQVSYNC
jgi:hypothetical protein